MLTKDKILGCYWGLALGDALGMPVEFHSIEAIRDIYGEDGILNPEKNAIWTDDTEMTIAVTNSLLRLGEVKQIKDLIDDTIGRNFAEEFINWLNNPGYSPGRTTTHAVNFLKVNGAKKWKLSGVNDSKGCGTVMRAAPLGIWFANSLTPELPLIDGPHHKLLFNVSMIQSEITHGHKAATAAALAGSYAVALAINGMHPDKMINPIEKYCNHLHSDFENAMQRLKTSLTQRKGGAFGSDLEALTYIGQGWVGEEAFAMALYSAIQYANDLKSCLRVSVNHDGDSDSVACIAGSILGAFYGTSIIPKDWIDCLAEKERMEMFLSKVIEFF
ncbi:MAG: ADP-ribosylglycohydrolase family protein [Patescibacteria group bacterium]|nr:ADP-ribosylglycohydrolase family protein [Patescibacteria group bacterium]